jgi:quercetin dioxygenase-like cupin family protein
MTSSAADLALPTAAIASAEVVLGTASLAADLAFFTERLGFALVSIFPADDPREAVIRGHGARLRLQQRAAAADGAALRLLVSEAGAAVRRVRSPGGIAVELAGPEPARRAPAATAELVISRLTGDVSWVVGRAGMLYRDLIPGRLGGAIIASHIKIPRGGPVPDLVHYHAVRFQLIFCVYGWVRLVYEDQGPPFVLRAGDCVTQPPQIRHRVLEASDNLQVVEVGLPAEHLTLADHELALPTTQLAPLREFAGQRFCRSAADAAVWTAAEQPGFVARDTGVAAASGGVASVRVLRAAAEATSVAAAELVWRQHDAEAHFTFVLAGSVTLHVAGREPQPLATGDSFVVPPRTSWALAQPSPALELLEVVLPGASGGPVTRRDQAAPSR